jgi:hypothetical protein
VTALVAKKGSFKGPALKVGVGTNVALLLSTLGHEGIYIEETIPVPAV